MPILIAKEVSDMLKIKLSTVYAWSGQGIIPCFKLNGSLRFDRDDILKWVEKSKKEPLSCYNPIAQARGPRKRKVGMK